MNTIKKNLRVPQNAGNFLTGREAGSFSRLSPGREVRNIGVSGERTALSSCTVGRFFYLNSPVP